jgi:hydroxymethylpyrimidine pyrophosphatase-like HAD family hydrolase
MVQKLFVSDLDGTLLDNKKEIPKNCIEIIQKIKQMDGIFCIATGRM